MSKAPKYWSKAKRILSKKDKVLAKNILMPIIASTLDKISKDKGIDAHKIYFKLLKEIELIKNEQ